MTPTAKGTYLTIGIALMTAGSAMVERTLWQGLLLVLVGGGFIFLREFLKEA